MTVNDPNSIGAGTVTVEAASDSDGATFSTGLVSVTLPEKSFTLPEVEPECSAAPSPVTSQADNSDMLFVHPGSRPGGIGLLRRPYLRR